MKRVAVQIIHQSSLRDKAGKINEETCEIYGDMAKGSGQLVRVLKKGPLQRFMPKNNPQVAFEGKASWFLVSVMFNGYAIEYLDCRSSEAQWRLYASLTSSRKIGGK